MGLRKGFSKIALGVCSSLLILLSGVAMAKDKAPRDEAEAIQWAQESLAKEHYTNITVNSQYILFSDGNNNFGIALARILSTAYGYDPAGYWTASWQDYAHAQREEVHLYPRDGKKFKSALDFLAANAQQEATSRDAQELAQFLPRAQAWREAATKPAMPEEAHEHQVLAEFAFKEKNVDKAVNEYTSALSIFPTWPEGQYNLATLAGEQKLYAVAILHMKEYLELSPESPDAQAAKDSIIIWKDKLQTVMAASTVKSDVAGAARKPTGSLFSASSSR